MSGGELTFTVADVAGHDRLGRRHRGRRQRLSDLFGKLPTMRARQLLDILGSEGESQTRRRLGEEKTDPEGDDWDDWSEAYKERRPKKGGLLELEGDLLDSITYDVGSGEVVIGSNLVYARTHQVGDESRGIPERPYLGLSDQNVDDMQALVFDFLELELMS